MDPPISFSTQNLSTSSPSEPNINQEEEAKKMSKTNQLPNVPGDAHLNSLTVAKPKSTSFSEEESRRTSPLVMHHTYTPKFNMNPLSVLCKVINPKSGKSQTIRAIFDDCSSVTIMRRGIAEKLGLGTRKVDLSFTTTGNSCQLYKDELEVEFVLQSLKGDYTSNLIQAVTLRQVSRSFRRPRLNMESFPYLASIDDYTEDYDTDPTHATVDLLLGNPYSLIIGHEEKIRGPTEGSPMAVKTKLGTCVSGNLASQALQEDQTSHTTTATEVNPAPARRMLTSTANPEAEPSPHVTQNGNVSTPEAAPS